MRRKLHSFLLAIIWGLVLPVSASANADDISEIIREAQAQAVREAGSISEVTPEYIMESSKEIIAEEYGVEIEAANQAPTESREYHNSDYDLGYDDGYRDGLKEAERRYKLKEEEMRSNRIGGYFSILFVVVISIVISVFDKRKQRR